MKCFPAYSVFLLATALPLLAGNSNEETSCEIKFSDPAKPGTIKVSVAHGNLRIRGVDASVVTINSQSKPASPAPRKDGLRVLTASSSFNLTEKDNVITLDAVSDGLFHSSDFNLAVPRNTAVVISNSWGGDISCADVKGDIEIKNMNGKIKLDGVVGGVLVETMNGAINANVRELHEGKPLSFTSMNGEVVIRIPADAKANVRLRSQNGSILTDFDEKALVTKTESVARPPRKSRTAGPKLPDPNSNDSDVKGDIHDAVREVVKAGVEAAHQAAEALREASEAAKDAMRESADENGMKYAPFPPRPALPPMTGGKIVTGTLNEGGPEIQAATMNGDVTLRKLSDKM